MGLDIGGLYVRGFLLRTFRIEKKEWKFQVCFDILTACVPDWEYLYIILSIFNSTHAHEMDKLS